VDRYLAGRRARGTHHYGPESLKPILNYLRRLDAVPSPTAVPPRTDADQVLDRFGRYLLVERSLTSPVARAYGRYVRPFVGTVCCVEGIGVRQDITAGDVSRFLIAQIPVMSGKTAQMTACALRSLLRFLHVEGTIRVDLSAAVPAAAYWRLSGIPRPLNAQQITALKQACDRSDPVGRRDFAVILLLVRLGLRCAEAACLRLDDVDWSGGTLIIHGKGSRIDRLPLPVDVGEAVVDYLLCHGRPRTAAREVFVRACAPHTMLASSSLSCIVRRAAQRAELGTIHAHRLRHTAASLVLNAGASLQEVAELMRHATAATTLGYAKTDQHRLARVARRWPTIGGVL
jgi:integrase/recombinase XerD